MAKIRVRVETHTGQTESPIAVPPGAEDIEVQGEWLHFFEPGKGRSTYYRLPAGTMHVVIDLD